MSVFIYFLIFIFFVVVISWKKYKRQKDNSLEDYFLGGRSMGFVLIGSTLLLANLNAAQLVGENESVYLNNMSVMAWGVTSVVAMIIVAEFFMPIYLRGGFVTIPDFLEDRYDASTKKVVSLVFLFSYLLNMLPVVLYSGAVALNGLFNFSSFTVLNNWSMLWILTISLGVVGTIYTVIGGIKMVAVTDVSIGVLLFFIGICIPIFGLKFLGEGDFMSGLNIVLSSQTEHFNAIGSSYDAIPFSTIFTGMILVNLYYWGMEQFIIQRVLASKSLADSQKGIALSGVGKLLYPLFFNMVGIIAVHLYPNMDNTAEVFSRLAGDVLPATLIGLAAVVIFGATLSTFNAGLNSISALYVLNIYKPRYAKNQTRVSEQKLIKVGKRVQIIAAIIGVGIAPFIIYAEGGFYTYVQTVGGLFSVPIFTIIFVGFITRKVPPIAAKVGLTFFAITYFITQVVWDTGWHYLHILAVLFIITVAIMLIIGKLYPLKIPYKPTINNNINLTPWKNRYYVFGILIILMVGLYILFSPLGLVKVGN